MVEDTIVTLNNELKTESNVLVEGANATMLDIDFGITTLFFQFKLKKLKYNLRFFHVFKFFYQFFFIFHHITICMLMHLMFLFVERRI